MNLSTVDKDNLRRMIEEKVVNVPNGEKIKIDKHILENLIFINLKDNCDRKSKFICWSGEFLSKIDLSEVNFENVVWDINFCKKHSNIFEKNPYNDVKGINLGNCNVNIDFSKSYEAKYMNNSDLAISMCNFENVTNIIGFDVFKIIASCNLKDSGITISLNKEKKFDKIIINTNFERANLSNIIIDVIDLLNNNEKCCIYNCNVMNTGINITYNFKRPINYQDKLNTYYRLKEKDFKDVSQDKRLSDLTCELKGFMKLDDYGIKLGKLIKDGHLVGCYVNGKYIKPKELANQERKIRIEQLKKEKDELINSLEKSIDNQILKLRNKKSSGQVIFRC